MARPRKLGLDYFPFDVDFFNDEKIVCIAGEFGIKGEIVAIKLLCAIYRKGYFIEWSDSVKYTLLTQLPGISDALLDQIVSRLVKWGFFDASLFDSALILTSEALQRRYFEIAKFRKVDDNAPYLLLRNMKNYSSGNTQKEFPKKKTPISQEKNPFSQQKNPINKIKGKENKFSSSRACEGEVDESGKEVDVLLTQILEYKSKLIWKENVQRKFKIRASEIDNYLDEFYLDMKCREVNVQYFSSYFINWLTQKLFYGNDTKRYAQSQSGNNGIQFKGKVDFDCGLIED